MKKLFFALCVMMALSIPSFAAERVMEGAYQAEITINHQDTPAYFYDGIYYIPMNDYICSLLNINYNAETGEAEKASPTDEFKYAKKQDLPIGQLVTEEIWVNPRYAKIDDTVFIGLTYSMTKNLGLTLEIDKNFHLSVYGDSKFEIYHYNGLAWNEGYRSGYEYYAVSGKNCIMRSSWTSRFFDGVTVYTSYNGGEFVSLNDEKFANGYNSIIDISGDTATITAYYGSTGVRGIVSSTDENYELTIDIPSNTVTDIRLIKKVQRDVHGFAVDENGKSDVCIYTDKEYRPSAHYDGGHVILNGTMMRSYIVFYYTANGFNENGKPMAIFGSQHHYFIRAEDLENYGYDMVTDFENRTTYFTRNPEKAVTPLGFEGTNKNLPIYDSDWKIIIDGKEPILSFNIGGSTLISAKELGEFKSGTLDKNYDVLYVTTEDMKPSRVIGYYSVDVFDEPIENIQTQYLTDLMYAFILPKQDGSIFVPKPETLKAVVDKCHKDGVKVYASVGGYGTAEDNILWCFMNIAQNEERTRKFIENLVWMVREYNLDGIEIDWEHPTDDTADLFEEFMLKVCADSRLKSVSAALCGCYRGGTPIYASAAVRDSVIQALDFINVMAYDENLTDHTTYDFAVSSVNYWLSRGAKKNQVILGIPLYSQPSFWQYRHLAENGYDIIHSDFANTPYSPSYFNGLDTIKNKAEFAKTACGGVMFFDIHEDTMDETSAVRNAWEILYR